MKLDKVLIAGPWVGEFGWELLAWQGYIRSLSRNFDKTIIICARSSKGIYLDFADEFLFFSEVTGPKDSYFMHGLNMQKSFKDTIDKAKLLLNKSTTLLLPRRIGVPPATHWTEEISFGKYKVKPEYIRFGRDNDTEYDILFHIRSRKEIRPEDNWSIDNWNVLKEKFKDKKIACIGTTSSSGWIEGTDDLRNIPLGDLFDIMRNSHAVFGPSSGPMHLSSLCGCPHVVWSYSGNKTRYEENWNPLSTRVLFLDEYGWHPSPEYVYKEYIKWSSDE